MIASIAEFFTKLTQKYLPDAYSFAIILTFVVLGLGLVIEGQSPAQMLEHWNTGVWKLLQFSMQMILILVAGNTLATTPLIQKLLDRLVTTAKGPKSAISLVTLVSGLCCWLNWGFGLIVGGIMAVKMARRHETVPFALLVASAYSGFLLWHAGLSGSIPLKLAAGGGFMTSFLPNGPIGLEQTVFSPLNIGLSLLLLIALVVINCSMYRPFEGKFRVVVDEPKQASADPTPLAERDSWAYKLDNSRILGTAFSLLILVSVIKNQIGGAKFSLNTVNLLLLGLGSLLHQTPSNFRKHFAESMKNSSSIALQFPLYAGIMGMIAGSGLAVTLSNTMVQISSAKTLSLTTYLSAGLVNFFVPSGGGQWAVQGPVAMAAAQNLGASLPKVAMALAWGDAWTNMLQPFWALPLLAMAKVPLKDMMGYSVIHFFVAAFITTLVFLI